MDKLLAWSVKQQQEGTNEPPPDPKLLAQLFGAPDDAQLMVQAMVVITQPDNKLEDKEVAFDNLEMLVENLDNANMMKNLKLWEPLLAQLSSPHPSLQKLAAWVVATATQNNPKSQEALVEQGDAGIKKLVELTGHDDPEVVVKSLFALASAIRNCDEAYKQFEDAKGLDKVVGHLNPEAAAQIKSKTLGVLTGILESETDLMSADEKRQVFDILLKELQTDEHIPSLERSLHVLVLLNQKGFSFSPEEVEQVKKAAKRVESKLDEEDVKYNEDLKYVEELK
ncbi:Hsp70 nucleotide exchange factor FES1 [Yarrowia sp. C11]|nr:Hsp70 nucleotide exchange factor FES1 [Yarrowia sp. C11]KAG5364672.1 Hsp70 nucleotide exchange factor FES1 [Yarrowia sp. E02]